jgi:hypothetical protein
MMVLIRRQDSRPLFAVHDAFSAVVILVFLYYVIAARISEVFLHKNFFAAVRNGLVRSVSGQVDSTGRFSYR